VGAVTPWQRPEQDFSSHWREQWQQLTDRWITIAAMLKMRDNLPMDLSLTGN
jgi:hypothetical protein